MAASEAKGSKLICDALLANGVDTVFGLPGTQNVALFEALRTSSLRTVVATHELSAAMMANGYYRASGRVAALVTIPGPGFTWALDGIAEAALDSTALIHIVGAPAAAPGTRFQLQAIAQTDIVRPIVRAVHTVARAADVVQAVHAAYADALAGEPGPVFVQIAQSVLREQGDSAASPQSGQMRDSDTLDAVRIDDAATMINAGTRCVIFAGQGSHAASASLVRVAEMLSAAVVTTTSGRGAVPEDHPLSLGFECGGAGADTINALIDTADVVLAIGCKFSHNGSRGFALRIAPEKLIHVDTSAEVLGANYPARFAIRADAGEFLAALLQKIQPRDATQGFDAASLAAFRARALAEESDGLIEPRIHGVASGKPAEFFATLQRVLPRTALLVTDSGLHQSMARRHFRVLSARGLMTPTNLQSMGFAIGAATGACIADPERTVVALLGDGGLSMSGLELLTAVREKLRLIVIVFVDAAYGLIRFQQLASTGRTFATEFAPPDVAALAQAVGARYARLEGDAENVLRDAVASGGVTLIEVGVGDTLPMQWMRGKAAARQFAGPRARTWLRRLLGR
jgi:acetolactate synthase I/II/III large subunit